MKDRMCVKYGVNHSGYMSACKLTLESFQMIAFVPPFTFFTVLYFFVGDS